MCHNAKPQSAREATVGTRVTWRQAIIDAPSHFRHTCETARATLAYDPGTTNPLPSHTFRIGARDPLSDAIIGAPSRNRPRRRATRAIIDPGRPVSTLRQPREAIIGTRTPTSRSYDPHAMPLSTHA